MDQWLVRTARNRILGPYPREHVLQLIKKGEINIEDEVCQANYYWFYLHEEEEVFKQLGIEITQGTQATKTNTSDDEEVTVTQTQAVDQDLVLDQDEEDTDSGEDLLLEEGQGSQASSGAESIVDETAMITNKALRDYQTKKKPGAASPQLGSTMASRTPVNVVRTEKESSHYKPVVLGKIEKASFWRGFAMAMAGVVLLLVGIVVYVLRKG